MRKQLVAGLLLALLAGGVRADTVIFDNLSSTTQGFGSVSTAFWEAQRFNSDATNLLLTSATLTLYSESAGSGTFFVDLYSDAAGQPGVSLANLFTGPNPFGPTFPQSGDILFGGLNQALTPNTNYWIVLGESAGSALDIRWGSVSNLAGTGSGFQTTNATTLDQGGSWQVRSQAGLHKMQITATTPIPEPASALLALLGGLFSLASAGGRLPSRDEPRRTQASEPILDVDVRLDDINAK
jgi:hypothetical protein